MSTDERRSASARRRLVPQSEDEKSKANASVEKAREALRKRKKTSIWEQYSYHIIIGGFSLIIIATLLTTVFGKTKKLHLTPVIELDEIEANNQQNPDFKLGANSFFQDQTLADAKKILNNFFAYKQSLSRCMSLDENTILDPTYDFREKYPACVSPIVDQKNCSSSFAVASASAISDRLCMQSGNNVRLSAQHYLSCQEGALGTECNGGAIASFLDFAKRKGVVDENCVPYVGENNVPCDKNAEERCEKYRIQDYCVAGTVEGIKRDIVKNGPSIAYIPIYRDFLVYKSGVYNVQEGVSRFQGGHAMKIIGWGDGYWIVENSWGEDWGMKGYAHIAFGQEELNLDDYAFSPAPKVDKGDADASGDQRQDEPEVVNA